MVIQKERGGGSISLGGPKVLDIWGPRSPISIGIWAPYRGGGGGGGGGAYHSYTRTEKLEDIQ